MPYDPHSAILNWLEAVLPVPHEEEAPSPTDRPRKRARLNNRRSRSEGAGDKDRDGASSHLPTPSASASPSASRSRAPKQTTTNTTAAMAPSNNKRSRGRTGPDDDQHLQGDSSVGARPMQPPSSFSQAPSFPASKASKVSNNSSPTRQIRNAGLQPTGFVTASFKDDQQPESLKHLCSSLEFVHAGFGILPRAFRDGLIGDDDVYEWMFGDEPQFGAEQLPDITTVKNIWRRAARCDGNKKLPESAWNNDVHSRVLDWVFRDSPTNDGLLDYRCCFGATIIPAYQPESSPSKMIDYCVCIQPDEASSAYTTIERLCQDGRPGQSINHTDWGDLVSYPIGISIETKGPGIPYEAALVQVATWHAAQWRSIFHNRERDSVTEESWHISFLPGIIVIKHDWYFVATDRNGIGKARTFERKTLGSTESLLGIYKLVMALQKLAEWLKVEFWPAFQTDVLGLESDG